MTEKNEQYRVIRIFTDDAEKISERTSRKDENYATYVHYLLEFHDRAPAPENGRRRGIIGDLEERIALLKKEKDIMGRGD